MARIYPTKKRYFNNFIETLYYRIIICNPFFWTKLQKYSFLIGQILTTHLYPLRCILRTRKGNSLVKFELKRKKARSLWNSLVVIN